MPLPLRRALPGLFVLALLAVAGCEPAAPEVSLQDLPAPPGLERYNGSAETTVDGVWSAASLARGRSGGARGLDLYWLPAGDAWADVEAFYREQLPQSGWALQGEESLPSLDLYTRGGQRLVVGRVGIGSEEGSLLILALDRE